METGKGASRKVADAVCQPHVGKYNSLTSFCTANERKIAQRHGLFSATEGQILDMTLFETVPDIDIRWKTWSKVESVKRYVFLIRASD